MINKILQKQRPENFVDIIFCIVLRFFTQKCLIHPDKPGKLTQCIPIYGTILGQCTRNCANAGPTFLVCRDTKRLTIGPIGSNITQMKLVIFE